MIRGTFRILRTSVTDFFKDDMLAQSAGLAFYSALSFAPVLVLILWLTSLAGVEAKEKLYEQLETNLGAQASQVARTVIRNADESPGLGSIAGLISIGTLFFSAGIAVAHLQKALNVIWDVEPRPGRGAIGFARKRLLAVGLVIVLAGLLVGLLVVSSVLSAVLPESGRLWRWVDTLTSFVLATTLFALMFRFLPDVRVRWRSVWLGAAITAVLFALGRYGIGQYVAFSDTGGAYGAAGSLLVLLVWVYYSSAVFFFGAEITQARARFDKNKVRPSRYARWREPRTPKHAR